MKTTKQFALTFVVLSLLGSRESGAITSTDEINRAASKKPIPAISGSSFSVAAAAEDPADTAPAQTSEAIPWSQVGAKAGVDYKGDGLAVIPAANGARLRCVFQKMEGEVTREGLWLASTVLPPGGTVNDRFRIVATAVGRVGEAFGVPASAGGASESFQRFGLAAAEPAEAGTPNHLLPRTGTVEVADKLVRFIRPGLTEEYSASMDGVRQDFIIEQRPVGAGRLRVELEVAGAKVEPLADGARLVLENSGREIAYNRLRVTDATGKELPARMEVASGILPDVEGGHPAARNLAADFSTTLLQDTPESAGPEAPALRQAGMPADTKTLAVLVNDADAVYPVRIDPTLSDANWISMGGFPGANGEVFAAVVDGSGNLYIGGRFTLVGDVIANYIAKWNGSSWTALGSGMAGGFLGGTHVNALAVSGSDVYAGGAFSTAGGSAANYIAKWNGSSWSALGSGIDGEVSALAVSGSDVYAGGGFTTAGGSTANYIAKWNGSSWSALGSGMGGPVYALAVSGSDLCAGGEFTTAGGKVSAYIARAYLLTLPALSVLRSGPDVMVSWPSVDSTGFGLEQAGRLAAPAGWVANTASVTVNGTNKSVTVPATNSPQFFRLRRP